MTAIGALALVAEVGLEGVAENTKETQKTGSRAGTSGLRTFLSVSMQDLNPKSEPYPRGSRLAEVADIPGLHRMAAAWASAEGQAGESL